MSGYSAWISCDSGRHFIMISAAVLSSSRTPGLAVVKDKHFTILCPHLRHTPTSYNLPGCKCWGLQKSQNQKRQQLERC